MATQTKEKLGLALRELMAHNALEHITISDITDKAGVTRNTFYYHFEDIYGLLAWIYKEEVIKQAEHYAKITDWQDAYRTLLDYITENRAFCMASFNSVGRPLLERLLTSAAELLVGRVVETSEIEVSPELKKDISNFYGIAIAGQILQWLVTSLHEPEDTLVRRAEIMLNGATERAVENAKKL